MSRAPPRSGRECGVAGEEGVQGGGGGNRDGGECQGLGRSQQLPLPFSSRPRDLALQKPRSEEACQWNFWHEVPNWFRRR